MIKTLVTLLACALSLPTLSAQAPATAQAQAPQTFTNPVLWEDLADIDILRVGDAYYYSASNMQYSPGAPILRSYDLVHWEYLSHSIPRLDFGPQYDLQDGARAYVRGSWASFLGYRKSSGQFLWGGCVDFKNTHIYTAPAAAGPWSKHAVIDHCYYDAGLLVDDNDTMYVAYGNTKLSVAQLSPDGTKEVKSQQVFVAPPDVGVLEGSRFYKIHGNYYIFTTRPANGQYILKSTTGPFGPYTLHKVLLDTTGPVTNGGVPHQGGLVQTPTGQWFYMAFQDAFPGGRIPVLAPITWNADGWPELNLKDNHWADTYPMPKPFGPLHPIKPLTGTDTFAGKTLGPEWEWNHNPDDQHWSLSSGPNRGLHLQTATVTDDLYSAHNTLTHRILGPTSTATIQLDGSAMKPGDEAGLVLLRDSSAWVGLRREATGWTLLTRTGITIQGPKWETTSKGQDSAQTPLKSGKLWLRASADIHPGPDHLATFSYSLDGETYQPIGTPFTLKYDWHFFMGYRFGIFNYATKQLGGQITIPSFTLSTP